MKNVRRPTRLVLGLMLTIGGLIAGTGGVVIVGGPAGADSCAPTPIAAINATAPGQTFQGVGCYNISGDLIITKSNITISGGVWNIAGGMTVKGSSDTISGATLHVNTNWAAVSPFYNRPLVISGQRNIFEGDTVTVPAGVQIKGTSTTLDGGSYTNPSTTGVVGPGGVGSYKPIILVRDTNSATISNLSITGAGDGTYHSSKVNEAGIKLETSDSDRIINVTTANTFGDGLELVADLPHHVVGVTRLFLDGITVTNAGRHGVTLAEVGTPTAAAGSAGAGQYQSTLNYVNVQSAALWAVNFESDIPTEGSGYVTMNNVTAAVGSAGFAVQELLTGPIAINNLNGGGHLYDNSMGNVSPPPVTLDGGTWALPPNDTLLWKAGLEVLGGVLTVKNMTLNRQPTVGGGVPTGYAAWISLAQNPANPTQTGGVLQLINTTVTDPTGSRTDAYSTCGSIGPVYAGDATYAPCTAPIN